MKKHTTVQRTAKLGTGASDENDVFVLNRSASVSVDQDERRITVKPDPLCSGDHRQADTWIHHKFGQVVSTLTGRPTAYFDYRPLVSKAQGSLHRCVCMACTVLSEDWTHLQLTSGAGIYVYVTTVVGSPRSQSVAQFLKAGSDDIFAESE